MSNFLKNIHPLLRRGKRENEYDDTNFSVLNALNYELTQAERETVESKIQSSLESATGEYLDTWGDWFGVYRKDGWSDEYYRGRITRYLLLKRSTIPAIIEALADFLDDMDANIQIYEPWRNIFYLNKSKLNGEDHLMGYYYRFAIIDISIDRPFPPEIVDVIWAFKPAGVLFYLRMDNSLSPMTKVVNSGYVDLSVDTWQDLERWVGLNYNIRGNINLSQQATDTIENNIFYTNDSLLNGEDVLAGAFGHGRDLLHLACVTTLNDYTPTMTTTFSDIKTALGEADSDLYSQTAESDNQTARITVPKKSKYTHTAWSWSADGTDRFTTVYPGENLFSNKKPFFDPTQWVTEEYGVYTCIGTNSACSTFHIPNILENAYPGRDFTGKNMSISFDLEPLIDGLEFRPTTDMYINSVLSTPYNRPTLTVGQKSRICSSFIYKKATTGTAYMHIYFNSLPTRAIKLSNFKIEVESAPTIYTPAPSEDSVNATPQYRGVYTSDSATPSTNPSDYVWYPVNENPDQTTTKVYTTFDIGNYLDNYLSAEYKKLVTDLGQTQALNTLFNQFCVSTKLKALLSPSNGLKAKIQIYDFTNKTWHTLSEKTLTLNPTELNLGVNRLTDYLSDNMLLFIRYVFPPKTDIDTIIELDMLNITFSYRLGSGYTIGMQSTVTANTEIVTTG